MIAKQLSVPKSTLSYWLKDLPLSERRVLELRREAWSRGEASRELFRQTMRKKREAREADMYGEIVKKFKRISSESLFVVGLMLYLAEGSKRNDYTIALSNTDSQLIKFFIWWLRKFLGIKNKDMRMQLHLYENMNVRREQGFWLQLTGFSPNQLYKNQVRKLRPGSFSYSEGHRHGTCQIYVHGMRYKTELRLSIKAFLDRYDKL